MSEISMPVSKFELYASYEFKFDHREGAPFYPDQIKGTLIKTIGGAIEETTQIMDIPQVISDQMESEVYMRKFMVSFIRDNLEEVNETEELFLADMDARSLS